jgi:hypothetical protein
VRETHFHRELADAFRAAGYWMAKWPDQAVSRMEGAIGTNGKLRFALPKPCDLLGCQPSTGRLVAIEAKLFRAATFRVDARMARQLATLRDLWERGAAVALALNFRFIATRRGRVNRAFLVWAPFDASWREGARWQLDTGPAAGAWLELGRVTGGWRVSEDSHAPPNIVRIAQIGETAN